MKKVIGAVLAASLVAGMAFADVAVTLNARLRSNMYHQKKEGDKTTTRMFDLDGNAEHGGSGKMSDVLGFSAKTDYAGVVLDIAANRNASAAKTTKVYYPAGGGAVSTTNSGTDKSIEVITGEAGESFSFDGAYYGFLKFNALKFTFGTFDSRFVNRYNVTAGEAGLLDSNDIAKYGTALLNAGLKEAELNVILKDANNFSALGGDKKNTLVADYTIDDVADGKLLLKAALLSSKYKTPDNEDDDSVSYTDAGYGFEADFQNDAVAVQALVKLPTEKQTVFGAYVEPKALPLPLAFGFSYGSDKTDGKKYTAYAVDARVGYQINDQAKVSSVIKYEAAKPDGGDNETALTVAAEVSYIVNDLATVFADVGYYNADLDGSTDDGDSTIKIRPGVVLTAGKGARVTAAVQYDKHTGADDELKSEVSIPVIFRVKL